MGNRCEKLYSFDNVCQMGPCVEHLETLNVDNDFEVYKVTTKTNRVELEVCVSSKSWKHPIIDGIETNLLVHFHRVQPLIDNQVCPFFKEILGLAFHCTQDNVMAILQHAHVQNVEAHFFRNIHTIIDNIKKDQPASTNRVPSEQDGSTAATLLLQGGPQRHSIELFNLAVKQDSSHMNIWNDVLLVHRSSELFIWRILFQIAVTMYALQCSHIYIQDINFDDLLYQVQPSTHFRFLNYLIDDTVYHMFVDFQVVFPFHNQVKVVQDNYPLHSMWLQLVSQMVNKRVILVKQIATVLTSDVVLQQALERNNFSQPNLFETLVDPLPVVIHRLAAKAEFAVLVPHEITLTSQMIHFALRQKDFDSTGNLVRTNPADFVNMREVMSSPPLPVLSQQQTNNIQQLTTENRNLEEELTYELIHRQRMIGEVIQRLLQ